MKFDLFILVLVKIYAKVYEIVKYFFSFNLPGLGFLYRNFNKDRIFIVKGKKLFFNSKIADNYGMLINNKFNENETHLFLNFVFSNKDIIDFHFVDIGGNIGEFVLDYSDHPNVTRLSVFEPQPEQAKSIENTISLNNFSKTELFKVPVSDDCTEIFFNFNLKNSTASGITVDESVGTKLVSTKIDTIFSSNFNFTYVFLIDTEGAELSILKGGAKLIRETFPLIIFEYNHVTSKYFKITDVKDFLGNEYQIYKLDKHGKLSNNFNEIWNLVAVPKTDKFYYLNELIVK